MQEGAPTVRLAGIGRQGRRKAELRHLDITQKNGKPNHPTTQGKVERFQQTFKKWLRARSDQPATIPKLQALLGEFIDVYNHRRPHRSLPHRATLRHIGGRTPARTHVIMLIDDLPVRVVNAITGELLRELTTDTSRDYHPCGKPQK
ncbi:MAG: integrase catalytic subunit [Aeromicrobium sp.]|nr:integrase catalytic subunit [Aeromicrobium sp.]